MQDLCGAPNITIARFAAGAVLSQNFEGQEHPVVYASRKFSTVEQTYGATECQCLAVVWATKHFRCYLYGQKFVIVTDSHALKWLMRVRE